MNKKNEECLRKLSKPVSNFRAIDSPPCVCNIDEETGLQKNLFLGIVCRVMLTYNNWVEGGSADGTMETVGAVIYNENITSSELYDYIMVQFDSYDGPCINGNLFSFECCLCHHNP